MPANRVLIFIALRVAAAVCALGALLAPGFANAQTGPDLQRLAQDWMVRCSAPYDV